MANKIKRNVYHVYHVYVYWWLRGKKIVIGRARARLWMTHVLSGGNTAEERRQEMRWLSGLLLSSEPGFYAL